jgi:hypothetical protein
MRLLHGLSFPSWQQVAQQRPAGRQESEVSQTLRQILVTDPVPASQDCL